MYELFAKSPERAHRFGNAMSNLTKNEGYDPKHLVNGYDWQSLQHGKVVDVSRKGEQISAPSTNMA